MNNSLRSVLLSLPLIALFHPAANLVQGQTLTYAGPQPSLNFGSVNICPAGSSIPSPCTETLSLSYNVTAGGTLGATKVLTLGAPNLDFTLASGGTCTGTVTTGPMCTVNVKFAPLFAGARNGAVEIVDGSGAVLATTFVYGIGVGPQIAFSANDQVVVGSGLNFAGSVAVDGTGNLFIGENEGASVVKLPAGGGAPTTVVSGLLYPQTVALDGAGNLFIGEWYELLEVPAAGGPNIVLDGWDPNDLRADGAYPSGLAVDGAGDLFVSVGYNGSVVELPAGGGAESTVATGLSNPTALAIDGVGDLFIATHSSVVKLPAGGGAQTTVGTGLDVPGGVAVDGAGNVFISNQFSNTVVEVTAGGTQTTVPATGLVNPIGLALDAAGDLFIADTDNSRIVELPRSQPPTFSFGLTAVGHISSDSPQSVTIQNIGNSALVASGLTVGDADFTQVPGSGTPADCGSGFTLASGASCDLSIQFAPTEGGPLQSTAVLVDNALNATGATQTIDFLAKQLFPRAQVAASISFGSVLYGSVALNTGLSITNVGGGVLTVSPSINGPSYTVLSSDCGSGVASGNSCDMIISYSPVTVGLHNDLLTLVTNGPSNPVVKLLGSAIGISASAPTMEFGPIPLGTSELLLLTILDTNAPNELPQIAVNDPSYKILTTGNTCLSLLMPGHSCTAPVEFDPTVAGPHNATLTITPSYYPGSGTVEAVTLLGSASTVAPTVPVLNFGSIPFGTTELLLLTIEDVGAPGTVTLATSINGPSYKILTAGNTCLSGLTNGQSCTLPVEFDPVNVEGHDDLLTITPSGGGFPSIVPLLGKATS